MSSKRAGKANLFLRVTDQEHEMFLAICEAQNRDKGRQLGQMIREEFERLKLVVKPVKRKKVSA